MVLRKLQFSGFGAKIFAGCCRFWAVLGRLGGVWATGWDRVSSTPVYVVPLSILLHISFVGVWVNIIDLGRTWYRLILADVVPRGKYRRKPWTRRPRGASACGCAGCAGRGALDHAGHGITSANSGNFPLALWFLVWQLSRNSGGRGGRPCILRMTMKVHVDRSFLTHCLAPKFGGRS